jgi:hypothetical protein
MFNPSLLNLAFLNVVHLQFMVIIWLLFSWPTTLGLLIALIIWIYGGLAFRSGSMLIRISSYFISQVFSILQTHKPKRLHTSFTIVTCLRLWVHLGSPFLSGRFKLVTRDGSSIKALFLVVPT